MSIFLVAQILGGFAVAIQVLTYQRNTRKHILLGVMSAQILFVLQFLMIGAYTGAAVNIIGATRNFIFSRLKKITKSKQLLWTFLTIQLVVSVVTWHGAVSVFALMGAWLSTIAFWQSDPRNIRRLIIFMPICWLVYNFTVLSYAGIASNIFVLASTSIAMYRYDRISKDARESI